MKAIIIGGGAAAEIHVEVLSQLGIELACVCDKNLAAAKALAERFSAKATDDMDAALLWDADFCVICTPSGTHPELAVKALNAGKNVIVEKPLGLSVSDCDRVIAAQNASGKICAPISQLRFSEAYRSVKKCLSEGALGKIVMASLSMKYYRSPEYYRGSWKGTKALDGGELFNQGIHGLDIMCGLLGKPVSVTGRVCTRFHSIEAEDTAVATVQFADGTLAAVDSSTAVGCAKPRRFEICGTDGMLVMEEDRIVLVEGAALKTSGESLYNGSRDPGNIGTDLHRRIYENIISAFRGETALEYTVADAARTVRLICGIYESSETGRAVSVER